MTVRLQDNILSSSRVATGSRQVIARAFAHRAHTRLSLYARVRTHAHTRVHTHGVCACSYSLLKISVWWHVQYIEWEGLVGQMHQVQVRKNTFSSAVAEQS
uniref:Uncharacterized protein n=1 Tax=Malurus cyaneus samueli TaxID=2593467 RepID=A0A8C5TXP4_9PASS